MPAVTYLAVGAGAPLALTVRQHIGNHPGLTRVHFAQFIERQQGIVVAAGNSFQRIPGGPPGVPVVRAATDGGGHLHHRGFAVGGLTAQVKTATARSGQAQQRGGQRTADGKDQP